MKTEATINLPELISKANLEESTKAQYTNVWKRYIIFAQNNCKNELDQQTVSLYLKFLNTPKENNGKKLRITYIKKQRKILKILFQNFLEMEMTISPIKWNKRVEPEKRYLTENEVKEYIKVNKKHQKESNKLLNKETTLIEELMINTNCQIHSLARLKLKHLEFLKQRTSNILLLAAKGKLVTKQKLNKRFKKEFRWIAKEKCLNNEEDYIFSAGKSDISYKRSQTLQKRIGLRLKSHFNFTSGELISSEALRENAIIKEKKTSSITRSKTRSKTKSVINCRDIREEYEDDNYNTLLEDISNPFLGETEEILDRMGGTYNEFDLGEIGNLKGNTEDLFNLDEDNFDYVFS